MTLIPALVCLFFVSVLTTGIAAVDRQLPDTVLQRNHFFKCYGLVHKFKRSYEGAQQDCVHYGGRLAVIKSKATNTFLTKMLNEVNDQSSAWIGLSDITEENKFVWSDQTVFKPNGQHTFSGFPTGRGPSNKEFGHFSQDCVALDRTGQWLDEKCGNFILGRRNYICEFKKDSHACNGS